MSTKTNTKPKKTSKLRLSRQKNRSTVTILNESKTKAFLVHVGNKTNLNKVLKKALERIPDDPNTLNLDKQEGEERYVLMAPDGTLLEEQTLKNIATDSLLMLKKMTRNDYDNNNNNNSANNDRTTTVDYSDSEQSTADQPQQAADPMTQVDNLNKARAVKSDWVKLNVGGTIIATTRSTLCKEKGSMLAAMFGGTMDWKSTVDDTGAFLIDRTPQYFVPILNYLRTGTITIDDGVSIEGVLNESKFFGIQSMIETLNKLLIQSRREISRKDLVSLLLTSSTNASLRCQGLNLSGIDLSRLDLSGINFRFTSLAYANLSGCNLDNTQLEGAVMSGANLTGASLRGANLSGANLSGSNLKGANFEDRGGSKANLESCNLMNCNLEDANLAGAALRAANLKGANLENSNLRSCDLAGANMEGSNLRGCNLHKANLKGANLVNSKFDIRSVSSR